jgi:hypothetical protein
MNQKNFFFQICFIIKNIYFYPTYRLQDRLQLKYLKVIIHIVFLTGDFEQSSMSIVII